MKRGTPHHPKVYELAEALGVSHAAAVGYLEMLFHFTAQYAPQGNVGKYSDKRITAALGWKKHPEKMIQSLLSSRWLEVNLTCRYLIHDWSHHMDRSTSQRLSRLGLKPFESDQQDTGEVCTQSETDKASCRGPKPVPVYSDAAASSYTQPGEEGGRASVPVADGHANGTAPHPPPPLPGDTLTPTLVGRDGAFQEFTDAFMGPVENSARQTFDKCVNTPELIGAILDNTSCWMQTKKYGDGFVGATEYIRSGVWKQPPRKGMYQPPIKSATLDAARMWLRGKHGKG